MIVALLWWLWLLFPSRGLNTKIWRETKMVARGRARKATTRKEWRCTKAKRENESLRKYSSAAGIISPWCDHKLSQKIDYAKMNRFNHHSFYDIWFLKVLPICVAMKKILHLGRFSPLSPTVQRRHRSQLNDTLQKCKKKAKRCHELDLFWALIFFGWRSTKCCCQAASRVCEVNTYLILGPT